MSKVCGCCGGTIPPETSEAWQQADDYSGGECPGSLAVDAQGNIIGCGAFPTTCSWEEGSAEDTE